jgi:ribonuclease P protein component
MLPFKNRLKKEKEIERVLKEGETFKNNFFVLKKIENDLPDSRFCLSVPKHVLKKVVDRNKLKRRMREIIRENLPKIKGGFDVLIIALPLAKDLDFKGLKESLNKVLREAKILK